MKKLISLLLIFFSVSSFAQNDTITRTYFGGISINYDQKFFHDDFDNNLKSINKIESNAFPVEIVSINLVNYLAVSRKFYYPSNIRFSYIIPKNISIDSVSQKLSGLNLNLPIYGHKVLDNKNAGLFISEGNSGW